MAEDILDKTSSIPMHHQLYRQLKAKIEDGTYPENSVMPSEAEIEEMYGISRVTVRRAVADLEIDGFVKKRRGSGTYVLPQRRYKESFAFKGFSEEVESRGEVPGSIVLECKEVPASVKVSEMLQINPGETVGYLKRLRLADGRIRARHETFISLRFGFRIDPRDFGANTSLYDFYSAHGIELASADETLEVRMPTPTLKTELFMSESMPLLYRERISFDQEGRPIEFSENYDRAEQHKYHMHMERTNGAKKGKG